MTGRSAYALLSPHSVRATLPCARYTSRPALCPGQAPMARASLQLWKRADSLQGADGIADPLCFARSRARKQQDPPGRQQDCTNCAPRFAGPACRLRPIWRAASARVAATGQNASKTTALAGTCHCHCHSAVSSSCGEHCRSSADIAISVALMESSQPAAVHFVPLAGFAPLRRGDEQHLLPGSAPHSNRSESCSGALL